MTAEQIAGLVRTIVAAIGGYFAVKGIGDAELWTAIAGGAATVGAALWSFLSKPKAVK